MLSNKSLVSFSLFLAFLKPEPVTSFSFPGPNFGFVAEFWWDGHEEKKILQRFGIFCVWGDSDQELLFFFFANSSQGFLFQLGVVVGAQWSVRLPRDREGEGSTPSASIALPILDSMYGFVWLNTNGLWWKQTGLKSYLDCLFLAVANFIYTRT